MGSYIDIIIRSGCVYLFMLIAIRVFGKRELTQLNTSDVILILLVSNAVQNAMVGKDTSLIGGLLAALILFLINFGIKKIMIKSDKFANIVQGKPEVLIYKGSIDMQKIADLDISVQELKEAVREHGIEHVSDVKLAVLEVDGNISIIDGKKNIKVW